MCSYLQTEVLRLIWTRKLCMSFHQIWAPLTLICKYATVHVLIPLWFVSMPLLFHVCSNIRNLRTSCRELCQKTKKRQAEKELAGSHHRGDWLDLQWFPENCWGQTGMEEDCHLQCPNNWMVQGLMMIHLYVQSMYKVCTKCTTLVIYSTGRE